jgi:flagellar motor switch protein FliG
MSSASDQRIRHVAIVLQSLDAATSRGLLSQLPPAQSKLVRQAMVQMGTVTPQERAAAFQSMQGLLNAAGLRSSPQRPSGRESLSPAAALLASQNSAMNDQVELSREAIQQQNSREDQDQKNQFEEAGSWRHMPAEALAEILQGERPIVIATVFNQVSVERATAISQALPIQVAAATLAALPNLHLADPEFVREIQLELERKIGLYQSPKKASAEGISKLQAIVASLPAGQQESWTRAISQSNPVLGAKLGWNMIGNSVTEVTNSAQPTLNPTDIAFVGSLPLTNSQEISPNDQVDDIFDSSMVLPFRPIAAADSSRKQPTAPEPVEKINEKTPAIPMLQDLLHFSDKDFVAVLHACEPQTVLLALSGASKPFMKRVEKLIPAKDVKRLRVRLSTLSPIQLREVDAAQKELANTALRMLASGEIGATASVSFTAAA